MPVPLICSIVEMAPASCCAHPVYMLSLCLEIEALEHAYLLPALVQVARYRASCELASSCNSLQEEARQQLDCLAVPRHWRPEARDERGCDGKTRLFRARKPQRGSKHSALSPQNEPQPCCSRAAHRSQHAMALRARLPSFAYHTELKRLLDQSSSSMRHHLIGSTESKPAWMECSQHSR